MDAINTSSKNETLTFGIVARLVKLSKLQIRTIFALVNKPVPDDKQQLNKTELRHILLADLLENIKFLKAEQRSAILLNMWTTDFNEDEQPCCGGSQVVFADSRYCTWSGNTGWLDLVDGDVIETLPCPPLETIAYNLVELERQARVAIANRSADNVRKQQDSAGSMEEQGYVRVGPTDAVYGQVRHRGPDVGPDDNNAGS